MLGAESGDRIEYLERSKRSNICQSVSEKSSQEGLLSYAVTSLGSRGRVSFLSSLENVTTSTVIGQNTLELWAPR